MIAAELPADFVVENHLNVIKPLDGSPKASTKLDKFKNLHYFLRPGAVIGVASSLVVTRWRYAAGQSGTSRSTLWSPRQSGGGFICAVHLQ